MIEFSNYGQAVTEAEQKANADSDIFCVAADRNMVHFRVMRYEDVGKKYGVSV